MWLALVFSLLAVPAARAADAQAAATQAAETRAGDARTAEPRTAEARATQARVVDEQAGEGQGVADDAAPRGAPSGAPSGAFRGYRRIDTEHFRIIYEPRDRESAAAIAEYADETYEQLAEFLENRPRRRIRVWVNGRTDAANGYFMPLPPNHIAIHVASPSVPWIGARTEDWLRLVFVHELAHHLHFMYEGGVRGALSRVFGEPFLALPGAFLPGWAIEGVGVDAETRFTEGGRGRSPYFEHYYAAPIIEERMFDYARAGFESYRPPRGRFYVAGYLMVDYLIDEYGEDVIARIHQEYLRLPLFSWNRAIESVTGVSAEHNYLFMTRRLEERYGWRRRLPAGDPVSPEHIGDYHLPRVADGSLYLYRTRPDRPAAIVRVELEHLREAREGGRAGGEPEYDEPEYDELLRTGTLVDGDSFDVTPDGTRILFSAYRSSLHHAGPLRQDATLYLWEEGRGVRRVPPPGGGGSGDSDGDGEGDGSGREGSGGSGGNDAGGYYHPVFVGRRHAVAVQRRGAEQRLVWVELATGETAALYEPAGGRRLYWPQPSPDGERLVFTENHRGMQSVYELELPSPGRRASEAPQRIPTPEHRPAYRARYAGSDRLLFSLETRKQPDTGGPLVLHEWRRYAPVGEANPRPVYVDRVGVLSAEAFEDTLYYATYRSDGYALRSVAIDALPAGVETYQGEVGRTERSLEATGVGADRAAAAGRTDSLDADTRGFSHPLPGERRFIDAPRLGFWLPIPSAVGGLERDLYWGGGIFALGGTFGDPASTYLVASYHPELAQPYLELRTALRYGRLGLEIAARHRYGTVETRRSTEVPELVEDFAEQRSELDLTPSVLLYGVQDRGVSKRISLHGLASYTALQVAEDDFSLRFDTPEGGRSRELLELGGGVSASRSGPRSERDLYTPRLASARAQLSGDLPEFGRPRDGVRPRIDSEVAVPLGPSGRSLSLVAGSQYSTGTARIRSPYEPPGYSAPAPDDGLPGWVRARLSYRTTLALTDIPLRFGFHIGGFAAAVFVERQAEYDLELQRVEAHDAVYLGVELLTLLGYNIGRFPLRTGITFKLEPNEPAEARFYIGL